MAAELDTLARFPFLALVRRELITQLRTRRVFFALVTVSLTAAWIVLAQWPQGEFRWQTLVWRSEQLFSLFCMLALTGGPVIVAAVAGTSLVGERERESWDLLQLSLISRFGLTGGKLLSPYAMFVLTLAVCAPIVAALLFLAGVDFVRAGQALLIIGVTSLTSGAIALACSARARRSATAVTAAFFFVALFMGLDAVAIGAVMQFMDGALDLVVSRGAMETVFVLSPYYVLGILLSSGAPPGGLLAVHLGIQGVVLVVALGYCIRALDRGDLPLADANAVRRPWFRRRQHKSVHPSKRPPIPDGANPVFRRELYWGSPYTNPRVRRFFVAIALAALIVSAAVAFSDASTRSQEGRLLMAVIVSTLMGAAGCLYVPMVCASAYTKELAISNYDMLRGTLMHPRQIVWGKFKAALVLCAVVLGACFLISMPVYFRLLDELRGWEILLITYGSLYAALVEAAAAGLLVSFYSRGGGAAILGTYAAVFALFFGIPLFGAFMASSWGARSPDGMDVVAGSSPVAAYFWILVEILDRNQLKQLDTWFGSLAVAMVFAAGSQQWMIGRFHARMEKLAGR